MVSDLVARIREILARPYEPPTASYRALSEAADAIESLSRQLEAVAEQLEFNAVHLMAEDDKDDALKTVEDARGMMSDAASALRRSALEASNA